MMCNTGKIDQQQRSKDRNQQMAEKKRWNRNSDAGFGTIFIITKLVNVFKGASKNFIPCLFFLFEKVTLKKLRIFSMFFDTFKKFIWRPSPSNNNRRGHRPGRLYASFFKSRLIRQRCTQRTPAPLSSYTVTPRHHPQPPTSISWHTQRVFSLILGLHHGTESYT